MTYCDKTVDCLFWFLNLNHHNTSKNDLFMEKYKTNKRSERKLNHVSLVNFQIQIAP